MPKSVNRVNVCVRVRPYFEGEDSKSVVIVNKHDLLTILMPEHDVARQYQFDHVFPQSTGQQTIYEVVGRPIVRGLLKGLNGTILAYGQTGSGKTYTTGLLTAQVEQSEHQGLVYRSLTDLFQELTKHEEYETKERYSVTISFLQIYLEHIQDLLAPENDSLMIRESKQKTVVKGLSKIEIKSAEEGMKIISRGLENRVIAPTLMNTTSSRSHTILRITVSQHLNNRNITSTLRMVDLAGSERLNKSESTGPRLHETKCINKSLSTLGNVIAGLARISTSSNIQHIPFRDSKLTRLLKDVLTGNSQTVVIATVSPTESSYQESLSTLKFARRCMNVQTRAVINEKHNVNYKELSEILQKEVDELRVREFLNQVSHSSDGPSDPIDGKISWGLCQALYDSLFKLYELIYHGYNGMHVRSEYDSESWISRTNHTLDNVSINDDPEVIKSALINHTIEHISKQYPNSTSGNPPAPKLQNIEPNSQSIEDYVQHISLLYHRTYDYIQHMNRTLEMRDQQCENMKRELSMKLIETMSRNIQSVLPNTTHQEVNDNGSPDESTGPEEKK